MFYTTLNKIRACSPCEDGWEKLLRHLGKTSADDEPLSFAEILKSNGLEDALWCCRTAPDHLKEWRMFMVWCARSTQLTDPRSIIAINVAEKYAHGLATIDELCDAMRAVGNAYWAIGQASWDTGCAAGWAVAGFAGPKTKTVSAAQESEFLRVIS